MTGWHCTGRLAAGRTHWRDWPGAGAVARGQPIMIVPTRTTVPVCQVTVMVAYYYYILFYSLVESLVDRRTLRPSGSDSESPDSESRPDSEFDDSEL